MNRWVGAGIGCVAILVFSLACMSGCVAWLGFNSVRSSQSIDELKDTTPVVTTSVEMRADRFIPAVILVNTGETITWVNTDTVQHNVVFRRNGPFSSYLKPGEAFVLNLSSAGVFDYGCSLHKGMMGRVIVAAPTP